MVATTRLCAGADPASSVLVPLVPLGTFLVSAATYAALVAGSATPSKFATVALSSMATSIRMTDRIDRPRLPPLFAGQLLIIFCTILSLFSPFSSTKAHAISFSSDKQWHCLPLIS